MIQNERFQDFPPFIVHGNEDKDDDMKEHWRMFHLASIGNLNDL
jgi:hypothetical protein